jgi:hypothetical protein
MMLLRNATGRPAHWLSWPHLLQFLIPGKEISRVGFEVLTAVVMKNTIFWDITPCSPLKVNQHFGGTYSLQLQGRRISLARNQRGSGWQAKPASTLVSCSAYSSTLKMEVICYSETSVDFQRTTQRYIQKIGLFKYHVVLNIRFN